ncbi:hypothetical protein C1H76_4886 [Elsinoe australis]|uniref:Uncharacterized protein n=1 Tax=Elsinoe australis TaxID=40998 RepID=A0A4V6DU20_9PEZI|nr:hypothetical protein C1H76_4886 [Elsinoe australis]
MDTTSEVASGTELDKLFKNTSFSCFLLFTSPSSPVSPKLPRYSPRTLRNKAIDLRLCVLIINIRKVLAGVAQYQRGIADFAIHPAAKPSFLEETKRKDRHRRNPRTATKGGSQQMQQQTPEAQKNQSRMTKHEANCDLPQRRWRPSKLHLELPQRRTPVG